MCSTMTFEDWKKMLVEILKLKHLNSALTETAAAGSDFVDRQEGAKKVIKEMLPSNMPVGEEFNGKIVSELMKGLEEKWAQYSGGGSSGQSSQTQDSFNWKLSGNYVKLTKENYFDWKKQIGMILKIANLENTVEHPTSCTQNQQRQAMALIHPLLSIEMMKHVDGCATAAEMMNKINDEIAAKNLNVRIHLNQLIHDLRFGELSKTKEFLDEFEELVGKYRMSGGEMLDDAIIERLGCLMPREYFGTIFDNADSIKNYEELKKKLLIRLETELYRKKVGPSESSEMKALMAEVAELKLELQKGKLEANFFRGKPNEKKGKWNNKPQQRQFQGTCFVCDEKGHRKDECPNWKAYQEFEKNRCNLPKNLNKYSSDYYVGSLMINSCYDDENEEKDEFVLDSGATHHFCGIGSKVKDARSSDQRVYMANGRYSKVHGIGTYAGKDCNLKDVVVVPALKNGLISVSKMTDKGFEVLFTKNGAKVLKNGKLDWFIPRVGNLYKANLSKPKISLTTTEAFKMNACETTDWHGRLGHPGETKMKQLEKIYPGRFSHGNETCEPCLKGKWRQGPHRLSDSRAEKPLQLVHMDIAGPHLWERGYDGSQYFLVMIDDHTRYMKVYTMKDRTEVLNCFKQYRQFVESHTDYRVKQIRTDQAKELMSMEFENYLRDNQIWHQYSTAHIHQQNGNAERGIQTVRDKARTNMEAARVPKRLWPEAVKTAALQVNVLPHSIDPTTTPHRSMFGRDPDYDRLHEFGETVYYYLHPVQRDSRGRSKFEARSQKSALMGFDEESKGYRVWDAERNKLVRTSEVRYLKNRRYLFLECGQPTMTIPQEEEFEKTEYEEAFDWTSTPSLDELPESEEDNDQANEERDEVPMVERLDTAEPETEVTTTTDETAATTRPRRMIRPVQRLSPDPRLQFYLCESQVSVPENYEEAVNSPEKEYWQEAMDEELRGLLSGGVFQEVEYPENKKPISSKWVFTLKVNPKDSTIERFKARLVLRGFEQKKGIDYDEVFAPVVTQTTVRCFLTFAAVKKMLVHQVDVEKAFTHADIDREIYVEPPTGMRENSSIWILKKNSYGLKQAPRCWSEKICSVLNKMGFNQGRVDPCQFWKKSGEEETRLIIYVDDILVASTNLKPIEEFKRELEMHIRRDANDHPIRDLGEVKYFLGMQINYDKEKQYFEVSQEKLIEDYMREANLLNTSPVRSLPQIETIDFESEELSKDDVTCYRALIGSLLHVASHTRPDISFPVNFMSRFMQKPNEKHLFYARKVLRYLFATKYRKLRLGRLNDETLTGYSDASYAGDQGKSHSGVLFTVHGSVISWISRKQDNLAQSTTEAESCALQLAAKECLWLRQLLVEMGVAFDRATTIYEDNQQVIKLIHNGQIDTRAKYLTVRLKAINDLIMKRHIGVTFIASREQWADLLTKTKVPLDIDLLFTGISSANESRNRGRY